MVCHILFQGICAIGLFLCSVKDERGIFSYLIVLGFCGGRNREELGFGVLSLYVIIYNNVNLFSTIKPGIFVL